LVAGAGSVQAQSGAPIKIGFSEALSGGLAVGGKSALLVYQMWAEEVNARGGLLGRKVELVYYDDQSNPSTVPAIFTKLLEIDKVDLVMSGYATVPTAAAMPVVMQHNKLFMSLFALAVNENFKYPRYFQMQPNGPNASHEFSKGFIDLAMALDPKPKTLAMVGADAEYPHMAMSGARINAKAAGLKVVYDRTYPPSTIDFVPIIRAIKATNAELVFLASYPPDTAGLIRAAHEVGIKARMFGGGTIGLQFSALKTQLGPLLNGILSYDLYVPEKTMQFPGVEDFLKKYRERAGSAGVDPLGFYIPPYAYAEMQILEQAIKATNSLDDGKLADYIHKTTFKTVVGDIKFAANGEWAEPRLLLVQYRDVKGNGIEQFEKPGTQVIVYPPKYKSGEMETPYDSSKS
jgi:branched-chain amino acid transport system substrate-binding protein